MATECTLRRADGRPFGSFAEVQALIHRLFPAVVFGWTTSGPDKLRIAKERGVEFPPVIRESLETLPSLLEGVAEGDGYHVTFGLGHEEPVACLYVTPRGNAPELGRGLTGLEAAAGARLELSGDPGAMRGDAP
ncbi:MAG: hypothetical protein C0501_11125 [Isosphaera sp.]|nr:hypothetical protein [Isosphaera sp.]